MEILYWLEGLRTPLLDNLMLLITEFGSETAFLVAALIVFWCVDKNKGYYLMGVGFLGTIVNQFLKLVCRVPRPWVRDEGFSAVEAAKADAGGYSLPSGHSQNSVGTFGGLALTTKNKVLRIVFIAIAVLVPFSRMYLGVHTPADVLVGSGCALAMAFGLRFLSKGKFVKQMLFSTCVIAVVYLLFVQFVLDPAKLDGDNYSHGLENCYTLLGAVFGMLAVYFVDEKWLHFEVKAVWWAQILKVLGGLAVVLVVKSGLKEPLNMLLGELPGRAVRYLLIVLVAGIVWPMSFRWFARMGGREK